MNNYTYAAELIKERVTMHDAIALYAPSATPRHDRIPCPVHGGTNYNMSFTDKFYHCHKCGSGGDVIHFVQHIFGLSFIAALNKLNTDFSLGLPLDRRPTLREQREAQQRHNEIMAEREREREEKELQNAIYNKLCEERRCLNKVLIENTPKSPDELSPIYADALHKLAYTDYLLDALM